MREYEDDLFKLEQKYLEVLTQLKEEKKKTLELASKLDISYANELRNIVLEKENSILAAMDALIFYSDADLYHDYEGGSFSTIDVDSGQRARNALQNIKFNA